MKTIKEYFKKINKDEIIRDYIHKHPITISSKKDEECKYTYDELYNKVDNLIEKIRRTEIKETDEKSIFIVHHSIDILNPGEDITCSLFNISEITDEPEKYIPSYAYEFTPLEETIGFFVADTYLTQYYINDVLVDFLYEMSFFGYDQEFQKEKLDEILKSVEECKNHEDDSEYFTSADDFFEKMEKDYGWISEKHNTKERTAYSKLLKAVGEYNKTARDIELNNYLKSGGMHKKEKVHSKSEKNNQKTIAKMSEGKGEYIC